MTHDVRNSGELRTQPGQWVLRWGVTLSVVAVALALTSCASAPTPAAPVVTATATKTSVPEPPKTSIEQLAALSFEKFDVLDQQEQLVLVAEQLRQKDGYIGENGGALEKFNPLNIASIDNSGDQIVKEWQYAEQSAFFQRDMSDLVSLDKVAARKMLAGCYYYTESDGTTSGLYAKKLDQIDAATGQLKVGNIYSVDKTSDLQQGKDRYGIDIKYRDITYHDTINDHLKTKGRFVYVEYKNAAGTKHGAWLAQQLTNNNESFPSGF